MQRRVILHRPDLELRRLTARDREALLLDDVRWGQASAAGARAGPPR
jgi:arginine deiminase